MSFVSIENIKKDYANTPVLRNVSFNLEQKEQCALVGASGSGKSTLLYLMGGLERASSGSITVDGNNLNKVTDEELAYFRNRCVGFVFQFHFLLPSMSCLNNILLPARIGGLETATITNTAKKLADILGVSHCLEKMPYQLSGGEQQRVNIIRAMSLKPKLLLCDEPTGNLDSENTEKVAILLKQLAEEFNSTLLVVTHDEKVATHFSRKITIEDGQIIS